MGSTFWFGLVIFGFFEGISILSGLAYAKQELTPQITEAVCQLLLSMLMPMVVFASFVRNPSAVFVIQMNWKLVLIESLRTVIRCLIGFLCFVVPGIYLTVRYLFVPFIVMGSGAYKAGKRDALKTSWKLTQGLVAPLLPLYLVTQGLILGFGYALPPFLREQLSLTSSQEVAISTLVQFLVVYPLEVWTYLVIGRLFLSRMREQEDSDELAIQLARDQRA